MSNVPMGISLHANTQHRAVLMISLYEKLSTPQNLPYLKQSSVKCLEKIVDYYAQSYKRSWPVSQAPQYDNRKINFETFGWCYGLQSDMI